MNTSAADVAVLLAEGRKVPRPLRGLTTITADAVTEYRRVVVVGSPADLAAVLTRLLKADRLDIEVAHVRWPWHARRARTGLATRIPLIRDETGAVITGAAYWLPPEDGAATIRGEATVDDAVLFHGEITGVRIEPTTTMPGLRAAALSSRMRPTGWVAGRAAQLGTEAALVVRDGVPAQRPVRRSTFYRHTQGWLQVR